MQEQDKHSLESRSLGKVEDINTKRYATCVGSPDIFVGIVRRIVVKKVSKYEHKAKSVSTKSLGGSQSDTESDEVFYGVSSQSYNSGGWIVNSGASSHMTQLRHFLVDYEGFNCV